MKTESDKQFFKSKYVQKGDELFLCDFIGGKKKVALHYRKGKSKKTERLFSNA